MPIVITHHTNFTRSGLLHIGTIGDDVFSPTTEADTFVGGGGQDTVSYADEVDGLVVATGIGDLVPGYGTSTADRFYGISELIGTDSKDFIQGDVLGENPLTFYGRDGDDYVGVSGPNSVVFGGAGHDFIETAGRDCSIYGGDGDDALLSYGGGATHLFGGAGSDLFEFNATGQTTVYGGSGDDVLRQPSYKSDLLVYAGDGNDIMVAGQGSDVVFGGAGSDTLSGGAGNDTIMGGDGNDVLSDRVGMNVLDGGAGDDVYFAMDTNINPQRDLVGHTIVESLGYSEGGGIDTIVSNRSFVLPENVEILRLVSTAKVGEGNAAPNALVASTFGSKLLGHGGNDRLVGLDDNDTLSGGMGRDFLVGGGGADVFLYTEARESRAGRDNRDFINGFDMGEDKISLTALADSQAAIDRLSFIDSQAFSGSAGEVRIQGTGGHNAVIVEADTTGDGVADFQILVNGTDFMSVADFDF